MFDKKSDTCGEICDYMLNIKEHRLDWILSLLFRAAGKIGFAQ